VLEEALAKSEATAETKPEKKGSKKDIQSRLDFLARMYASNKATRGGEEEEESENGEEEED